MKLLARILIALLCVTAAHAQDVKSTQPAAGQYPGTTTNDSACAGCVGEFKFSGSPNVAFTPTITIASPAVISGTHTYNGIAAIVFTTGGALPTGITSGTVYYTSPSTVTNGSFNIATTVDNAVAGTFVNTSGTQSGVHSASSGFATVTGTTYDYCALSLTAGDWDVWLAVEYQPANTTTVLPTTAASVATTSATLGSNASTSSVARAMNFTGSGANVALGTTPTRASIATTTTYYGVFRAGFGTSTLLALDCAMSARRRR